MATPKLAMTGPSGQRWAAIAPPQPPGAGERPLGVGRRHQDRKLLAPMPRRHVARTDMGEEDLGHGPQYLVPGRVAVRIVVRLEAVEVQQHQRQRLPVPRSAREGGPQRLVEMPPVPEAGQLVRGRQPGQPRIRLFHILDPLGGRL